MPPTLSPLTLHDVGRALALPQFDARSAWLRMAPRARPLERPPDKPGRVKLAGTLLLLYPLDGELAFVLTRRTDSVANHKGQVSMPGGMQEPGETLAQTALRETCEELRVCLDEPMLIGRLAPLYVIVSDFEIATFVAFAARRPAFDPDPVEVAAVIETPVIALLDDALKATERWTLQGMELDVPFYQLGGQTVWGATAAILSEFEWRLRAALA